MSHEIHTDLGILHFLLSKCLSYPLCQKPRCGKGSLKQAGLFLENTPPHPRAVHALCCCGARPVLIVLPGFAHGVLADKVRDGLHKPLGLCKDLSLFPAWQFLSENLLNIPWIAGTWGTPFSTHTLSVCRLWSQPPSLNTLASFSSQKNRCSPFFLLRSLPFAEAPRPKSTGSSGQQQPGLPTFLDTHLRRQKATDAKAVQVPTWALAAGKGALAIPELL